MRTPHSERHLAADAQLSRLVNGVVISLAVIDAGTGHASGEQRVVSK